MRHAVRAMASTTLRAVGSSSVSSSTSQGLAIARKRPTQLPPSCARRIPPDAPSEPEAVAELGDDGIQVGGGLAIELIADQQAVGDLALLLVVLDTHAPFVAARGLVAELQACRDAVKFREPVVGRRVLRQGFAVDQ